MMRDKVGFASALLVYTPSPSLPLEARGRGLNLTRPCIKVALSNLN